MCGVVVLTDSIELALDVLAAIYTVHSASVGSNYDNDCSLYSVPNCCLCTLQPLNNDDVLIAMVTCN